MTKEVRTDEAQEGSQADRAGGDRSKDGVAPGPDRWPANGQRSGPLSWRLKRSLEVFPTDGGSIYLLRSGIGQDFVLMTPTAEDRLILNSLAAGFVATSDLELELAREGLDRTAVAVAIASLYEAGLIEPASRSSLLSASEVERYDRQLIYLSDLAAPGADTHELQARLRSSRVVLLGCGGLGTWAACGLACAGLGSLTLIDDDRVELSNLNRQLLFTEADLGRLKVEAAAEALLAHNSTIELRQMVWRIGAADDLAEVLIEADLLIATADWPPFELPRWVNEACLDARVAYITAGQFLPWVRVGPLVVPGETACLECLERAARRDFPLYEELATFRSSRPLPGGTVGASAGLVGSMLAMEAIHFLTGARKPASQGFALIVDVQQMTVSHQAVERDPSCPHCPAKKQPRQRLSVGKQAPRSS